MRFTTNDSWFETYVSASVDALELQSFTLIQDSGAPGTTTNRLYNNGGNLSWSGDQLATLAGTETLTNKTLTNPTINAGSGGVTLPQGTDVSANTAEGRISWDSDDDKLYVGDGASVVEIGAGGGGGTVVDTITIRSDTPNDGWNGAPIWAQKMKHSGTIVSFQVYCEVAAGGTLDLQKNGTTVLSTPTALVSDTVVEGVVTNATFSVDDVYKVVFDNATAGHFSVVGTIIVEYD